MTGLPEGVPKGSQLPDGSYQISATGPMYRGPGAGANGPFHRYVFELYALDIKLDAKPTADAFETRANVMKAIQGHILAKARGGLRGTVPAVTSNGSGIQSIASLVQASIGPTMRPSRIGTQLSGCSCTMVAFDSLSAVRNRSRCFAIAPLG